MPVPPSNIERIDLFGNPVRMGIAWTDEILQYPEVLPMINPNSGYPAIPHMPTNPPGTPEGTYPTPTNDAAGIGIQWANWIEYWHDRFAEIGRVFENYALCPLFVGGRDDGVGITKTFFGYASDAVTGAGAQALTSPLYLNGLAFSKAQFETAIASLKSELDSRGLPYPGAIHDDNEHKPYLLDAVTGSGGWFEPLIDGTEPRGDIDEMYDSETFLDKWDSSGVPEWFDTQLIQAEGNRPLFYWLEDLIHRVKDRVQQDGIADPAKVVFPGIPYSCYGVVGNSGAEPVPTYYYWLQNPYPNIPDAEYLSIPQYLMARSDFTTSLPNYGIDAWLDALGLETSGDAVTDLRNLAVERAKRQLDAQYAAMTETGQTRSLYCWLMTTHYTERVPWDTEAAKIYYSPTEDNIREIARYDIEQGVRAFNLFVNDGTPLSESDKAMATRLVRDMRTWAVDSVTGGNFGSPRQYSLKPSTTQTVAPGATVGLVQVTAPPDRPLKVLEYSASFDGTSQSARPLPLSFVRMSVPGTGTACTAKKLDPRDGDFEGDVQYGATGGTVADLGGGDSDIPFDMFVHPQGNPATYRPEDLFVPPGETAQLRFENGGLELQATCRVIVEVE